MVNFILGFVRNNIEVFVSIQNGRDVSIGLVVENINRFPTIFMWLKRLRKFLSSSRILRVTSCSSEPYSLKALRANQTLFPMFFSVSKP